MEAPERLAFAQMIKARLERTPRSRADSLARLKSIGLLTQDGALAPGYGGAGIRNSSDFEMAPSAVVVVKARVTGKASTRAVPASKQAAKKMKRKAAR